MSFIIFVGKCIRQTGKCLPVIISTTDNHLSMM